METKEKNFEQDIESYFLSHGYVKGCKNYNRTNAVDMPTLIEFMQETQPKEWHRYVNLYGEKAEKQLFSVFQHAVSKYGLLQVLRNGIRDRGVELRFAYFEPASSLNEELVEKYNQNILSCTRQFGYSTENTNTIDMVLLLNGIPIVAIELKNQLTGQTVENAKRQFREDRNPKEFPFRFNNRFLVYFAVDLYEVAMTTELKGKDTYFLPFNQGSNGAGNIGDGGNPENPNGYATSYLWEHVLEKKMLLNILQRYMNVDVSKKTIINNNGERLNVTSTKLIFPRYHQLDVVEKLIDDTRNSTEGKNYLLQHSAGSGKSNEIAWLSYRLASLHNDNDEVMFQSVFVITDRRLLNSQIQNTVLGFDHKKGQVATITDGDNSNVLKQAIEDKKRIIISTVFRFPYIYKELEKFPGKRFAIIVDEAHSSQSGKAARMLQTALADNDEALKEMAEIEEKAEEEILDDMDTITAELLSQGRHKNEYFYAFTATPKPKTLETFGVEKDGKFEPFHNYSMRQAISEGFILDVLQYYTTIGTSYEVAKTVDENPELEEPPATRAIKAFHDNNDYVIRQKIEVIVEKFREVTLHKLKGKAKAMVVCPSRAHAVRYFLEMKDYCRTNGYADVRPLVAFSGTVKYNGVEFTEPQLNTTPDRRFTERNLPEYFASDLYNILIVADKYQTGFDEPRLHTMFVDKGLRGVKAVQTLSRLNRSFPGKIDTFVLDFANSEEEIRNSFQPFYEGTILGEGLDVNMVYDYVNDLKEYHLWDEDDEDKVYQVFSTAQNETSLGKMTSLLKPTVDEFLALEEEDQFKVRSLVKNFNRLYAYMIQIVRTFDRDLYKTYIFTEFLYKLLPRNGRHTVDLNGKLMLERSVFFEGFSGAIVLDKTNTGAEIKGEKAGKGRKPEEKKDLLDNILDKINEAYGGQVDTPKKEMVESLYAKLKAETDESDVIQRQAQSNDLNMFVSSIFPKIFQTTAMDCYREKMDAFTMLFEDKEFYQSVMQEMAKGLYYNFKKGGK